MVVGCSSSRPPLHLLIPYPLFHHKQFVIATKSPSSSVFVFDYSKHPSTPSDNLSHPQHRCAGHTLEGYGLCWSPHSRGILLSGSDDATICVWDLAEAGAQCNAMSIRHGHESVVEDVDFHHYCTHMFGSVGDDGKLLIWDLREKGDKPTYEVLKAHNGDVNCLSFNPKHEHMVATGGSDALVNIWDLRFLTSKLHECTAHKEGVFQVSWSPHSPNILGSCSSDRRLLIWDLSKIGAEQSPEDAQDGPPELLFVHGGHTAKVSDFSWNCSDPWTIASVAEDNILHIWQPTGTVYMPDGEGGSGAAVTDEDLEGAAGARKKSRA